MARDYFIQTTSLVPPRGVSVEMTEIRPLRPNQCTILPGVAVLGQGLKFQVKEKSKYRSRSGFSQSDGIAQFSANYNRRSKYKLAPRMDSLNNGINGINDDNYRPPSYEPYRPQQPRSLFPYCSDDESYLNRQNSSLHSPQPIFPDLKITNGPPKPLYPTSKRNLVPILKSDTSKNKENKKKTITSNWEISNREPKSPNSQNLNNFAFDDDLLRINRSPGNSSPKFASSHHGLCTNPGRNKATSSLGVLNTYDFLFDRHLRMLTTMESDQEDMINEEEIQTLRSIQKPLATHPQPETEEENSNDEGSLTESDELSMIGEDLVNRSLAEVTSLLDQQIDLNHGGTSGTGLTSGGNGNNETTRKTTKRISFLVPTSVCPQISISSAGSVASVEDEEEEE